METVKEFIENSLIIYDFTCEKDSEIMDYVIKHLDEFPLISKGNPDTKVDITECWNTDKNNFTEESLFRLVLASERYIIKWCSEYIHKLEARK